MIGAPEVVGEFGIEPGNVPSALVAVGGERQIPGAPPPKYGGGGVDHPSVLRQARMTLATCSPQARPRAIETLLPVLPGMLASESVSWASSAAACDG